MAKLGGVRSVGLSLFFLLQEILGVVFLFNFSRGLQGIVVLLKVGVSPFHFWLYYLLYFLEGYIVV
jgi:hypothetical protein